MKKFLLLQALAVVILALPRPSVAQTTKTNVTSDNATGLAPGQTFGGTREDIDYSTGNLNLQIPLLNLPGRHGANLSLSLTYNSKPLASLTGTWNEAQGATYSFGSSEDVAGLSGGWRVSIPMLQTNAHTVIQLSGERHAVHRAIRKWRHQQFNCFCTVQCPYRRHAGERKH